MKKNPQPTPPFDQSKLYSMRLGHEADDLLEVLGDYYFPDSAKLNRSANAARWILLHALSNIDDMLARAGASQNYQRAEGIEMPDVFFLNERIKATSVRAKRWHRRRAPK